MVQIVVTVVFGLIAFAYLAGVIVMLLNHDHLLHRV
jgi:hypothetical protein